MELQSVGFKPFFTLFLMIAIGPLVVGFVVFRQPNTISYGAIWAICLIALATFCVICFAMLKRSVALDHSRLVVKSTFYSTEIALTEIDDVQTVVPGSSEDIIGMRVNGVGLPGFKSGWFNSKLGGKIFVDRVAGDFLLISIKGRPQLALEFSDPEAALRALSRKAN